MQRDASFDDRGDGLRRGHVAVHFGVHEPKRGCFIANDGLIVRFDVRDRFF